MMIQEDHPCVDDNPFPFLVTGNYDSVSPLPAVDIENRWLSALIVIRMLYHIIIKFFSKYLKSL
jgi:hypothetical protein